MNFGGRKVNEQIRRKKNECKVIQIKDGKKLENNL